MCALVGAWAVLRVALGLACAAAGQGAAGRPAIAVGWHDEMNGPVQWQQAGGQPADLWVTAPGALAVRLPHVPDGFPYTYQWSTVTRTATVDLARYPVFVARVADMAPGTYAHAEFEQADYAGRPAHIVRSPTLTAPGLVVYDLGSAYGAHTWRFAIRLAVGGTLDGARCDFRWARFVRREDVPLLQEVPDWQQVTLRP